MTTKTKSAKTLARQRLMAEMLETTISGIPCLIRVDDCIVVKGSFNRNADSDWDYYGYADVSFTVYDRKGYEASWLEKKMTDDERAEIEKLIVNHNSDDGY